MFDLFTYFIYLSLLALLVVLTGSRVKTGNMPVDFGIPSKIKIPHIMALLLISFVVGFRYKVGVDWEEYKDAFLEIQHSPFLRLSDQYMEPGYFYINKIIAASGLSYQWMFFTMALITWYFFFKSVPTYLLPLFIFFVFVDELFFWGMNGVRQFAAMSIFLVGIKEILNKNLLRYLLLIIFAALFHKSVLLLIPLYFIPYHKLSNNKIWIAIFFISLVIGSSEAFLRLTESVLNYLGNKIAIIGSYTRYIGSGHFSVNEEVELGFGYLFKLLVNLCILLLSKRVVEKHPKTSIYFILFFSGAILFNLSYNIQLLGRINNYFLIQRSIVLAIIAWYYWKTPQYRFAIIGFMMLYFILFLAAIYNASNMCSPYQLRV